MSQFMGVGHYVPPRLVSNDEVAYWCDVTPEWIVQKTGVGARYYSDVETSAMAAHALERALNAAGLAADDLSCLVVCTSTPDQPQPATAARTMAHMGLRGLPAFDVNGVCAGFLYGLAAAESWRQHGPVAVIAADRYSTILNRTDRRTAPLFGDGAAGVILSGRTSAQGALSISAECDSTRVEMVRMRGGGSNSWAGDGRSLPLHFEMNGREIFEWASTAFPSVLRKAICAANHEGVESIERAYMHQGSIRILDACSEWSGIARDKFAVSLDRYGNVGAASLPLTLSLEWAAGVLRPDTRVLLGALGGGASACATITDR